MDGVMRGQRRHGTASLALTVSRALPRRLRGGIRELTSLYTPPEHRRHGHATRLMMTVCGEADKERIILMLTANSGMIRFYESFGFKILQNHPVTLMARQINV